jgi:uncharacterized membrane protein
MLVLAVAGTVVAAYLSWVALDPNQELVCGALGDCHAVQASRYAEVAGAPVALLGLLMYLSLVALSAGRLLGPPGRVREALVSFMFALSLGGTAYSAYLTYLELAVIDAICAWCIGSALIVSTLFVLTLGEVSARADSAKRSVDGGSSSVRRRTAG